MSEHSSENLDQSLSALMDNEASELELRRVLKSGVTDEDLSQELGQKWRRYHLASSIMRKDKAIDMQIDISQAVSIAIDQEESHTSTPTTENSPSSNTPAATATNNSDRSWKDMFIQTSIAASVAVACVLGVQQFNAPQDATTLVSAQSEQDFSQSVVANTASVQQARVFDAPDGFNVPMAKASAVAAVTEQQRYTPRRVQSNVDAANKRNSERLLQLHFEQLMREHAQTHRNHGNMGFLPYARVPNAEKQR